VSIDPLTRTCTGVVIDTNTPINNIFITTSAQDLTLPKIFDEKGDNNLGEGQLGVVIFDDFERPFLISFIEVNNPQKVEQALRPRIRPGEVYRFGPAGQSLRMDVNGNFSISSALLDGIFYDVKNRILALRANLINLFGIGYEMFLGMVQRLGNFILKGTELAFEFAVRLFNPITKNKLAEVIIGDVYDEDGKPIPGKMQNAVLLLRLFNDLGIQVNKLIVDKGGDIILEIANSDISFKSKIKVSGDVTSQIVLEIKELLVGGESNLEKVLLGETFWRQVFITHTHSTAVGPTSPPQTVLPDNMVLADVMKVKRNI